MATLSGGSVCQVNGATSSNCVNVDTSSFSTTNVNTGAAGYITTNQTPNPTYIVNNNLKWTVVSSSTQYVLNLVVTKVDGPNKYEVTIT
jgi:hypothetical protein